MSRRDELRDIVSDRLHGQSFTRGEAVDEANILTRIIVEACAREAEAEAKRWEFSTLYPDTAILLAADRILLLAPDETTP